MKCLASDYLTYLYCIPPGDGIEMSHYCYKMGKSENHIWFVSDLTFRRRIKSRLPFAGIISRLPYSTRFQDKG